MEEFTFGTFATDELKLVHHRATRRGLQHAYQITPKDPEPGTPVELLVRTGADLQVDHIACYYTLDGSEPQGSRGVAVNGRVKMFQAGAIVWDTLVWGYINEWRCTLPAQAEGVLVRYRIGAWCEGTGEEIFADWPDARLVYEKATEAYFKGEELSDVKAGKPEGHTFAYSVDQLAPPAWSRNAIIYQVFVDRFNPGGGRGWRQTTDLMDICGGTLWGVTEKLDYLSALGVNCLWLSPIHPSPSHHGYDATDIYKVESRLGGERALRELVREAHKKGMRVILDLVCNHISNQHPIFQDALSDPSSAYRQWFTFDDSEAGYRAFFGSKSMPELNLAHPPARDHLLDAARYWLREFDVDGYRLDYAIGPSIDFWIDFRGACKGEKTESYCFGEIVDAPHNQRNYAGSLDGCLDFHVCDALRRTYALGSWSQEDLDRFLSRHQRYFPPDFVIPTFLDNHDMDRFLFLAGGDKQALMNALRVQMSLPGPPIIYYGTEIGLDQGVSIRDGGGMHINRIPMVWGDNQDRDLLHYYQKLIQKRIDES
jgi:hypothetical protein